MDWLLNVVLKGSPTPENNSGLRASSTGELIFDNVKVPKENLYQINQVLAHH
jgi:alkylation response protein AidB-like acyl-CoA dehydrogenase